MNLCGGIVNVTDPDLILQIPDEQFSLTSRRKSATTPSNGSSNSSRRRSSGVPMYVDTARRASSGSTKTASYRPTSRGKSRQSPSMASPHVAGSPFLNPLSKEDMKKSRSFQMSGSSSRDSKQQSGAKHRVEESFNVLMLVDEFEGRSVTLYLDSEKPYVRIRGKIRSSEENENDGSKSNQADIRLKLSHLFRLEVGRDKVTVSSPSSASHKPNKCFTLVMRRTSGELSNYVFEADSLTERDTIVTSIKDLVESTNFAGDSRRRVSHSPVNGSRRRRDRSRYHGNVVQRIQSSRDGANGSQLKTAVLTTKAAESESGFEPVRNPPKTTYLREGRDDSEEGDPRITSRVSDFEERESASGLLEGSPSEQKDRDHSRRGDRKYGSRYEPYVGRHGEKKGPQDRVDGRDLSVATVEPKDAVTEVQGSQWSMENILCGMKTSHDDTLDTGTPRGSRALTGNNEQAIKDIKKSLVYESIGCHALGCNTQALANVEDVELAAMAGQVAGPWCTDDICTASLKDFTDTMKGIFEMKQKSREEKSYSERQRALAEDYIAGVLGAPQSVATLFSVKDMWNNAPDAKQKTERAKCRPRNRASSREAQAARLFRLRNQMTFNAIEDNGRVLQVNASFDDAERTQTLKVETNPDISESRASHERNSRASDEEEEDEIAYYDSDPGDVRERLFRRGPRKALAGRQRKAGPTIRRETLAAFSLHRLNLNRRWKRADDEAIADIIETMKNEKLTLMWHPTQSKMDPNRAPVCVKVWIESGVYLVDGTFILPKLTWIPLHEGALPARKLNISEGNPQTLDLLDVCRVRECDAINRRLHPFAKIERSFVIQTQSGVHLFETESSYQRERVVTGLKLVIARLASLLMLRDLRAVDEFFGGNSVPGEAPSWATSKNESATKSSDTVNEFPTRTD